MKDTVLPICAIFISICALCVSIWQGYIARKHDHLSVTPKLVIVPNLSGNKEKNGIFISNAGIGPAIIKSAILIFNGKEYDFSKNSWLDALSKNGYHPDCFSKSWLPHDSVIKASEELALLKVTEANYPQCYLEYLKVVSKSNVKFNIKYESFYEDKYSIYNSGSFEENDLGALEKSLGGIQ